jgi:hypothetical protein
VPSDRCPICHQALAGADPCHRPFCSERCRLLDLSAWTSERYRIPGERVPTQDRANDDDTA